MVLSEVVSSISNLPVFFMQFTIYDLFAQWEYIGAFDLLLPFLLIFALVFGILTSTNILGGHRGVNLIISLVIALMALRLGFVSAFFTELFPRFAIGLVVLMIFSILAGLFILPEQIKGWFIGFAIAGIVIGIIVTIMSFDTFYWFDSYFWQGYWGYIIGGIILIILIIAVFVTAAPKEKGVDVKTPFGPLRMPVHN